MFIRSISVAVAALLAASALTAPAGAEQRKRFRPPADRYYAGPSFVHRMPGLRVIFGDYGLSEEEFDALYGTGDQFDESYYEPEAIAPAKPLKQPAKKLAKPITSASTAASASSGQDEAAPVIKKPAAKPKATAAAQTEPAEPADATSGKTVAEAAASSGLSCDKASSIVSGYGFSAVKAQSCSGKTYAFNATRDGRPFAIKVDAANGELTEVKKLN
jgi:hypothetical protein